MKNNVFYGNPVKYINMGFVVKYKGMLLCAMESNERDMFKLVPVICGVYRRLIVAKGLLHFFESGLLVGAVVLSNQITLSFI